MPDPDQMRRELSGRFAALMAAAKLAADAARRRRGVLSPEEQLLVSEVDKTDAWIVAAGESLKPPLAINAGGR